MTLKSVKALGLTIPQSLLLQRQDGQSPRPDNPAVRGGAGG
jgi:hypothetical protein